MNRAAVLLAALAWSADVEAQESWSYSELPVAYRQRLLTGQPRFNPAINSFGATTVAIGEDWASPSQQRVVDTIDGVANAGYTWVLDYTRGSVSAPCDTDIVAGLGWQTAACVSSAAAQRARSSQAKWRWWLDAVAARGLTPIVRVDFGFFGGSMPASNTPGWELRRQGYARLYADYAAALVSSFPEVTRWQIGNEPDLWGGLTTALSASQYVDLISIVTPAMRAANQHAEIWAGVVSDLGDFWPQTYAPCGNMPDKLRGMGTAMLDSGISGFIDVFAVHDYHSGGAEGPSVGCCNECWAWTGLSQKQQVSAWLASFDLPPIALTEQGYALSWKVGTAGEKLTEQAQRAVKGEVLAMVSSVRPRIEYTFVLQSSDPLGDQESSFGIVNTVSPWSPRPAYDAIQRTNRVLDDSLVYHPEYATVSSSAVQAHSFRRLGTTFETQHWLWSTDGIAHTVTLRIVGTESVAPVALDLLSGTLTPLTYSYADGCMLIGALQIDSSPLVVIVPNRSAVNLVGSWFGWN